MAALEVRQSEAAVLAFVDQPDLIPGFGYAVLLPFSSLHVSKIIA